MQIGKCCRCGSMMPAVLKPVRRFMQWDSVLASERTIDTTEWIDTPMGAGQPVLTTSPVTADPDVIQTIYMRPLRFGIFGATVTPEEHNPSYLVDNERLYSAPKTIPATAESRHTFDIMPRVGMVPATSHSGPIVLTSVEYDVPGQMDYAAVASGGTVSETYCASVDAARLWINGDDVTGIVSSISPPIKLTNTAAKLVNDSLFDYKSGAKLQFTLSSPITLNDDDTVYIDIWFKIEVGDGWLPRIRLGSFDRVRTDLNPGYFRFSDSRTRPLLLPDAEQSINLALGYIWHVSLYAANTNKNVPRRYPWSVVYPEDTPWTFGDFGNISLQSPPSSTEYSTVARPFVSQTVSPANPWTVTTVGNIDDVVLQPASGDGAVCSFGPNGSAPTTGSGRWSFGLSDTRTVTKVTVWYRAKCDAASEGAFTNLQLRYTSGSLQVRNRTPTTSLTSTFAWYSEEFTGSDITGFSSATSCQVQIDASLSTVDGFVQLDTLYVDVQRTGDVTVTRTDSSTKLKHANGEEISFQWGREVPEIILGRRASSIPGALIVGSGDPVRALYKPRDSGDYFSGGMVSPTEYLESAGVWSPDADTEFSYWGVVLGNTTLYGREVFQLDNNLPAYFPETITLARN